MGSPLNDDDMLEVGTALEGHADNVAPALFGGLQVTALDGARVTRVNVPLPAGLKCGAFVPELSMPTQESRNLLPKRLSRDDAVFNSSRAALLVAALSTGRWDALNVATEERLHQQPRSALFPLVIGETRFHPVVHWFGRCVTNRNLVLSRHRQGRLA